jgi:VWFA-related protein
MEQPTLTHRPYRRESGVPCRRTVAALSLAASLLFAGQLAAAEEPPRDTEIAGQSEFLDVMTVDVVNVDVFVTDKDGNAITDLTRDDFEIFEDGRPVAITNFYAVNESSRAVQPRVAPAPPGAPPVPGVPQAEPLPEDQKLYLIVYIDNFNIRPFNRNRVFRRLREFLSSTVQTTDKVMLVTYNRSFKERVPFTSDPTVVNSALFELEKETGYGVHRDSERQDVLRRIDEAESASSAIAHVRSYAGSYYNDTMFTVDALKQMVSSLGGLPGRKALLYVSDGIPLIPAEDIYMLVQEKFQDSSFQLQSREWDVSRRYQELAAQANSNRVTFYTIDAGGLRTMSSASVETDKAGASAFIDSQNTYNLQAPLLQLAEATGGRAIINTNDVGDDLLEIAADLRTYYSLGYQPAHAGDGRYHRIEVKAKRRGLRVRHRAGYRDKGLEQRMSDGTLAALLFGEVGNPLGIGVEFGAATARDDGNSLVPIHVRIPLDKITLVPQAGQHEARLRVFVAAADEEGGMSPVQNTPLPIKIPEADIVTAKQSAWGYDLTLLMRPGAHRVAVGLRDELGGVSSYATGTVYVRGGR